MLGGAFYVLPAAPSAVSKICHSECGAANEGSLPYAPPFAPLRCTCPKKIRYGGTTPLAGDNCVFDAETLAITEILPRKNCLVRPPVANADMLVIVTAPLPKPDLALLDKLLICAVAEKIDAVIAVNKSDLPQSAGLFAEINRAYADVCAVFPVCAAPVTAQNLSNSDMSAALLTTLRGKTVCLAGASGVGKTSLIKHLFTLSDGGKADAFCAQPAEVGALSAKNLRGKNTTRKTGLLPLSGGGFLCDTPGFYALETPQIRACDLWLYYPDFAAPAADCRYHMCTHTSEPDCAVCVAVAAGKVNAERYERYKTLFNELKKQEKEKY